MDAASLFYFGIAVGLLGALDLVFNGWAGRAAASAFKGSGWKGLDRSPAEWSRYSIGIGIVLLLGAASMVFYALIGPAGLI